MASARRIGVAATAASLLVAMVLATAGSDPATRPSSVRAPGPLPAGSQTMPPGEAPGSFEVSTAVRHDRSAPLRRLEPLPAPAGWTPRTEEGGEGGPEPLPGAERAEESGTPAVPERDPVVQRTAATEAMPSPLASFDGISQAQQLAMGYWAIPPDTNGDVGPNHYVQMVNTSFAVYSKDGILLYGPASIRTVWTGAGGACAAKDDGDPVVLYDEGADRWLLSQFAIANEPYGPFYECIAVSASADPTGSWYRYEFKMSDTKMNDYPKFGVWPDGYYMSTNQFGSGQSWAGARVTAFERSQMLVGGNARMITRDLYGVDPNLGGLLPADPDGTAPPPGSPEVFAQMDDDAWGYPSDQLELWAFDADWTTPANSTFTELPESPVTVAPFDSDLCGMALCIPQASSAVKLDPLSDRLMWRLQYRNFGTYETLVTSHAVDANGNDRAGVRWYELRDEGSGWGVQQQGTFAPDPTNRWMSSAAMNSNGDLAVGYSVSSGSIDPGIRYAGRVVGDPAGQLAQGEAVLQAGGGSQTSASGRWGDYTALSIDPADDCTFWYTNQYYSATSTRGWRTRIGAFRLPGCGPPPGSDTTPPSNPNIDPFPTPPATGPIDVGWSAVDLGTGVASYDVYRRDAPWDGDFAAPVLWQDATTATGASYPGAPGTTSCFSVRARDVAGNLSAASSERCAVWPLDDASIPSAGRWKRRAGSGHYLGTYSRASARGAALTLDGVHADDLWLIADRCRKCGVVKVVWNGTSMGRINLKASTLRKMVVFAVASFPSTRTGTLQIRVSSSGAPVRIDGVAVGRA